MTIDSLYEEFIVKLKPWIGFCGTLKEFMILLFEEAFLMILFLSLLFSQLDAFSAIIIDPWASQGNHLRGPLALARDQSKHVTLEIDHYLRA